MCNTGVSNIVCRMSADWILCEFVEQVYVYVFILRVRPSPFPLFFALYFRLSLFNKQYKLLLFARKTRYKLPLKHIYMSRAHKPKNCSVFYWFDAYDGIVVVFY